VEISVCSIIFNFEKRALRWPQHYTILLCLLKPIYHAKLRRIITKVDSARLLIMRKSYSTCFTLKLVKEKYVPLHFLRRIWKTIKPKTKSWKWPKKVKRYNTPCRDSLSVIKSQVNHLESYSIECHRLLLFCQAVCKKQSLYSFLYHGGVKTFPSGRGGLLKIKK